MSFSLDHEAMSDGTSNLRPVLPVIHVNFLTKQDGITGTTSAPIHDVSINDDGSYTVQIDYWPAPGERSVIEEIQTLTKMLKSGQPLPDVSNPTLRALVSALTQNESGDLRDISHRRPRP